MIKNEWRNLLKHKFLLLVIVVIAIIPSIYSNIFLGSMWKPYNSIDKLPVAIINNDKGATNEGKFINIGKDLVEGLKEKKPMDIRLDYTEEAAIKDLKNGKLYMVMILEDDFSKNASKILRSAPLPMQLDYYTNPGMNYVSTKITDSALKDIQQEIIKSVQSTYIGLLFDNMHDMKTGFTSLKEGSAGLSSATEALDKGQNDLTGGLTTLTDSLKKYSSGADEYYNGVLKYTQGINSIASGATNLNSNSGALLNASDRIVKGISDGSNGLVAGITKLKNGVGTLGDNIPSQSQIENMNNAHIQINSGLSNLSKGTAEVKAYLGDMNVGIGQLKNSSADLKHATTALSQRLEAIIESMVSKFPQEQQEHIRADLKAQAAGLNLDIIEQGVAGLDLGLDNVSKLAKGIEGAGVAPSGITKIDYGISSLADKYNKQVVPNQTKLNNGYNAIRQGIYSKDGLLNGANVLVDGAKKYKTEIIGATEEYTNGVKRFVMGTKEVSEGISKVSNSSEKITNGAKLLNSSSRDISVGSRKLVEGSEKLGDATGKIHTGTKTIADKLREASDKLEVYSFDDKNAAALTKPIEVKKETTSVVVNNGHAMAPYMMTISLFVGAMALCIIYPFNRNKDKMDRPISWWGSKVSIMAVESIIMGGILFGSLVLFLGFSPIFKQEVFIMSVVIAFTFISLVGLLVINFGLIGEFLAMIILVLQLGTSEGTYPLALSSPIYSIISPFMPATYAIKGLKQAISIDGNITFYVLVLVGFAIFFNLLNIFSIYIRGRKIIKIN